MLLVYGGGSLKKNGIDDQVTAIQVRTPLQRQRKKRPAALDHRAFICFIITKWRIVRGRTRRSRLSPIARQVLKR